MHDYHQEYKEYYQLRMQRYEGNPDFPHSYQSEKAIYEAIASCKELGEFREKLGNKNELNAIAFTKDREGLRAKHYLSLQEVVRARGPQRIVARADSCNGLNELFLMVGEEDNKNMIEIALDNTYFFRDAFAACARIEVYEQAEVPSGYRSSYRSRVEKEKADLRSALEDHEHSLQAWDPNYRVNLELIWEPRHRRLLPFPDEVLRRRLEMIRSILHR